MPWYVRRVFAGSLLGACLAAGCGGGERAPFYTPPSGRGADDGNDRGEDATAPLSSADAGDGSADAVTGDDPVFVPMGCEGGPELRVLFIGNSHTFVNNVPALATGLACDAGTKLVTRAVTVGGARLIDHAQNQATLDAIAEDTWDVVVLQDQQLVPGWPLPQIDQDSVPAVQSLVDAVEANRADTRVLLYAVWARRNGDIDNCDVYPIVCTFEGSTLSISEGTRLYAERTDSEVASAHLAWAAVRADPDAPLPPETLWADDAYHAALPGSYLAAAVLVGRMLHAETANYLFAGGIDEAVARYLREVADRVVAEDEETLRVMTSEHVSIVCDDDAVCMGDAHGAPVILTLSSDDCAALRDGSATVAGRIHTRMSHRSDGFRVVPHAGWYEVPGDEIPGDDYRVYAHVDVDADGTLGAGDLDACEVLTVGSGTDLSITALTVR